MEFASIYLNSFLVSYCSIHFGWKNLAQFAVEHFVNSFFFLPLADDYSTI